jgi:hypothetical protein
MYLEELTFNYIRVLRAKVRRHEGARRYISKCIMNTVRLLGSVIVWGCFSSSAGCGRIYFLPKNTTMNATRQHWKVTYCTSWISMGAHTFCRMALPARPPRAKGVPGPVEPPGH